MGLGKRQHYVYTVDFGLTKRYRDQKTGHHIQYKDGKSLTGTARYASINAHIGYELSRRDDLISLGYVMIYFLSGSLPWEVATYNSDSNNFHNILEMKNEITLDQLCKDCPLEFVLYMKYCT